MFLDLSGFRSSRLTHAPNPKNVLGPIRANVSFTRVLSTGKMFLDLSGVSAARDRMLSLKNVPGSIQGGDGDGCKQSDDIVKPR